MARERGRIGGHKRVKRTIGGRKGGRSWQERQWLRQQQQIAENPIPEPSLAEKIVPWKRRRRKRQEQAVEQFRAQVAEAERMVEYNLRAKRLQRPWKGIHPIQQRVRLSKIRMNGGPHRDPQERKLMRYHRQAAEGKFLPDGFQGEQS